MLSSKVLANLGGMGIGSQGDRAVLGSIKYEEGYQQGYLAAKEMLQATVGWRVDAGNASGEVGAFPNKTYSPSFGNSPAALREMTPPPNESRALYLGCNTTPQGTPVPRDPPPRDIDRGDPAVGVTGGVQGQYRGPPNEVGACSGFQSAQSALAMPLGSGRHQGLVGTQIGFAEPSHATASVGVVPQLYPSMSPDPPVCRPQAIPHEPG